MRVETDLNGIVAATQMHSNSAAKQASASLVTDFLAVRQADALARKVGLK